MTPKHIFAAVGILLAILSFVIAGPHFVAAGVISVGVAVIIS